jgi:hypothetical protein
MSVLRYVGRWVFLLGFAAVVALIAIVASIYVLRLLARSSLLDPSSFYWAFLAICGPAFAALLVAVLHLLGFTVVERAGRVVITRERPSTDSAFLDDDRRTPL